jgi:orotidine-5'-phosphate decarboxylase
MTELIVALDSERAIGLIPELARAGVKTFKLSAWALMQPSFFDVLHLIGKLDCDWFADLKVYDTRDTVARIAKEAFVLGARFLTVHGTTAMLEAAMRMKKSGSSQKVLGAFWLTDRPYETIALEVAANVIMSCDGIVCPTSFVPTFKNPRGYRRPLSQGKIFVCPGIRHLTEFPDNHREAATPVAAKMDEADFIVVGRPIYDAVDPIEASRIIMEELTP